MQLMQQICLGVNCHCNNPCERRGCHCDTITATILTQSQHSLRTGNRNVSKKKSTSSSEKLSVRMSSFPCKAAYRSKNCPPLSDSDDDSDVEQSRVSGQPSGVDGIDSKETVVPGTPSPECLFVDETSVTATRTDSIVKLERNADELKLQIENIRLEMERVACEIREKKKRWLEAILKVVEFEKSIQDIELSISDKLHHFQGKISRARAIKKSTNCLRRKSRKSKKNSRLKRMLTTARKKS